MRRFIPTFLIIIAVLAAYPFIGMDKDRPPLTGLPWQIELLPDGHTKVFGIEPGKSTLYDVAAELGDDYELAIVDNAGAGAGLEMYFSHYRAGLMSAKMVLAAETDAQQLLQWQRRAPKSEYMESGTAKKYLLDENDRMLAMQLVVRAIAFVPAVNLDDEIIRKRFGEPDELVESADGVKHYLYPQKGLAIALSDQAKDVLQYVAPADFSRLRSPLAGD